MSPIKTPYHHGDLRETALQAGMGMLKARDAGDIGLRELARHIGVSATALYRHFPDKGALLTALAKEGMSNMGRIQAHMAEQAGGGREGFGAMGVAYVEFAVANPALFRLIFDQAPACNLLEDELDEVGQAMRGLRENIATLMPTHFSEDNRKIAALQAWSSVHGLAMLILDKQIEYDAKLIREVILAMRFQGRE